MSLKILLAVSSVSRKSVMAEQTSCFVDTCLLVCQDVIALCKRGGNIFTETVHGVEEMLLFHLHQLGDKSKSVSVIFPVAFSVQGPARLDPSQCNKNINKRGKLQLTIAQQ